MERDAPIYVAGHRGLVGSGLLRKLNAEGYTNLITRTHSELELERQNEVEAFFRSAGPRYVFVAADKVGGIWANRTWPADFIYRNLCIQSNVIHAAWETGVKRLLFLGSSCIYPRHCWQPVKEEYLLTGPLEATNEPYAVAKISGIKMCQSYNRQYGTCFISVVPTNLYGPNDNFDLETGHVLPALIRKFHEAKIKSPVPGTFTNADHGRPSVTIWGTGSPLREFLHVDDLSDACVFIMNLEEKALRAVFSDPFSYLINIGCGKDMSIMDLARLIKEIVGFHGDLIFDKTKPNGTPRKLLDMSKLKKLGWSPKISLRDGIRQTYEWCLQNAVL